MGGVFSPNCWFKKKKTNQHKQKTPNILLNVTLSGRTHCNFSIQTWTEKANYFNISMKSENYLWKILSPFRWKNQLEENIAFFNIFHWASKTEWSKWHSQIHSFIKILIRIFYFILYRDSSLVILVTNESSDSHNVLWLSCARFSYFLVMCLLSCSTLVSPSHLYFIASDMSAELFQLLLFPVDLNSMLLKDCEEWLIFRHADLNTVNNTCSDLFLSSVLTPYLC